MRRYSKIALTVLLLITSTLQLTYSGTAMAQDSKPVESRTQGQTEDKTKPTDYSKEAFIIEELKTSYKYESDGTGQREAGMRVKIQSDAGVQVFGQLAIPFSSANEKLDIDFVTVHKKDGSTVNATESNIQEMTPPVLQIAPVYTDLKLKEITVPGLRPGDTLEYHITSHIFAAQAPNQFWVEHNFTKEPLIVLNETLEVNIPQTSQVKLKNENGLDPVIKEENGRRIYLWKHAHPQHEDKKDKESDPGELLRMLEAEREKSPQIQMTTFKGWDEIGKWYDDLQRDRIVPNDKIRAKVAELTKGKNTDLEKIEAIYGFVAKNFRYVSLSFGIGRYQPHLATEIFANEYGDCKDKHTLLASMLSAAGIHADPVLINSSHDLDPDVPSPAQFDHVITAVPLGKETVWLDTTAEVSPFGMLTSETRKKHALLIPETGPSHLEMTPADPPFPTYVTLEITAKISEKGDVSG